MKIIFFFLLTLASSAIFAVNAAAVVISTDVPSNPISVINKQLQEKEADLLKKETELNKEQRLTQKQLFAFGGILFGLVFLNFYLDYQHRKSSQNEN